MNEHIPESFAQFEDDFKKKIEKLFCMVIFSLSLNAKSRLLLLPGIKTTGLVFPASCLFPSIIIFLSTKSPPCSLNMAPLNFLCRLRVIFRTVTLLSNTSFLSTDMGFIRNMVALLFSTVRDSAFSYVFTASFSEFPKFESSPYIGSK